MSDPRRLLDDPNVGSGAKDLLGSLDAPTPLAASTRSSIGARLSNSLVAPVATAKVASLKLWLLAGAVAAGGAGFATWNAIAPKETSRVATPVVAVPARLSPSHAAPPEPPPVAHETRAPEVSAKAPAAPARSASRRDTLALEESLLEQARRASDSPTRALALLREHERRFPNGELTAERLYLTAQVNARAGNLAAAKRSASLLAARFPKSTYLPRLRALLGNDAP